MYEGMLAETIRIQGHNGDLIDAYLARPLGEGPHPGVVMIHHMPGWDEASKEMARKMAYHGYVTISPDLHYRDRPSPTTPHEEVSSAIRAAGGMPDARTLGDVDGALRYLRALPYLNDRVGVIGFCSGGRQTFLVACNLPFDAAVDCWGGGVVAREGELNDRMPVAPIDMTANLGCPLLGLFGEEDARPSPAEVAIHEEALKRHGKNYRFLMYPNAGHGFFAVDRTSYRQEATVEGWKEVFAWFGQYLSSPVTERVAAAAD